MVIAASSVPVVRTLSSMRTRSPWGRRFEAARGLGHALCDPVRARVLGAGSGPYARGSRLVPSAYQLWNRGWLSSGALRDELIDSFSAGVSERGSGDEPAVPPRGAIAI